jgi:hypothetical protein
MKALAIVFGLVVASAAVLSFRLTAAPMRPEESRLAAAATYLRTHGGRDDEGRRLPIFVHAAGDDWWPAVPVYASMLASVVAPETPASVRFPGVAFGVIDVALMYLLVLVATRRHSVAALAALLLLCTPAHYTCGRVATKDALWQLPFVLCWLLAIVLCLDRDSPDRDWILAAGAAVLAASMYSQPSAAFMIPIGGAIGLAALIRTRRLSRRAVIAAAVACAVVMLPAAIWFARFPNTYPVTYGEWAIHLAHIRNPLLGVREALNWFSLAASAAVYWDFFSPAHLAVSDRPAAFAGVFLLPVAAFGAFGCWQALQTKSIPERRDLLVIAAALFIASPLLMSTYKEPRMIQRAMIVVPAGILLAALSIARFWSRATPIRRSAVVAALIAAALQFSWFLAATA